MMNNITLVVGQILNGDERTVTVNGEKLDPEVGLRYVNHSPTGFSWGYGGSGPNQLSFSILLHVLGLDIARKLYRRFTSDFICNFKGDENFSLGMDFGRWAGNIMFDGAETGKTITISTSHLSEDDLKILDDETSSLNVEKTDYGYMVFVDQAWVETAGNTETGNSNLVNILMLAFRSGYTMVIFDADGPVCHNLTTINW